MTKDDKINIDLDIISLINKLIETPENTKDAVMYIRADAEFETASVNFKGDVRVLAGAITSQLKDNPSFKQFFLSVIASWLSKNPNEELAFLRGLVEAKKQYFPN